MRRFCASAVAAVLAPVILATVFIAGAPPAKAQGFSAPLICVITHGAAYTVRVTVESPSPNLRTLYQKEVGAELQACYRHTSGERYRLTVSGFTGSAWRTVYQTDYPAHQGHGIYAVGAIISPTCQYISDRRRRA